MPYKNYQDHLTRVRERYLEKREDILTQQRERYNRPEVRERVIQAARDYRKTNAGIQTKERAKEKSKLPENKLKRNAYQRKRYRDSPEFYLGLRVRNRINQVLARGFISKTEPTDVYLGCDFQVLIAHIESQFYDGMSWDNKGQWHLDHIYPLCVFNLTNKDEKDLAFHYSNLQPLWAEDNLRKHSKVIVDGVEITDKVTIIELARKNKEICIESHREKDNRMGISRDYCSSNPNYCEVGGEI